MKNNLIFLFLIGVLAMTMPNLALAASCQSSGSSCPSGTFCLPNPLKYDTFSCLIDSIIQIIFYLALAIAPLMVVYAAFLLMTAAGNPAKVTLAKNIIIWTFVGLLVVFLARGISSFISVLLTGGSGGSSSGGTGTGSGGGSGGSGGSGGGGSNMPPPSYQPE